MPNSQKISPPRAPCAAATTRLPLTVARVDGGNFSISSCLCWRSSGKVSRTRSASSWPSRSKKYEQVQHDAQAHGKAQGVATQLQPLCPPITLPASVAQLEEFLLNGGQIGPGPGLPGFARARTGQSGVAPGCKYSPEISLAPSACRAVRWPRFPAPPRRQSAPTGTTARTTQVQVQRQQTPPDCACAACAQAQAPVAAG